MPTTDIDAQAFEAEVLTSKEPVLVYFWADWCSGCVTFAPQIDKFVEAHGDKLAVMKVNVDENRELADEYQVKAMPVLKVLSDGEVVKSLHGAMSARDLATALEEYI